MEKKVRGGENLTLEAIKGIKIENIKNETIKLWVYKKINNELVLINNNQPTFNSKLIATKELNISNKTITKYLDTNKYLKKATPEKYFCSLFLSDIKNYFFYSKTRFSPTPIKDDKVG